MGCSACKRRRQALLDKQRKKAEAGKKAQAAAIGAVLAVTQTAGQMLGLSEASDVEVPEAGAGDGADPRGPEPDR